MLVPPDPIPNSVVKRHSADGSVGLPHVRVGHCQSPIRESRYRNVAAFFVLFIEISTVIPIALNICPLVLVKIN